MVLVSFFLKYLKKKEEVLNRQSFTFYNKKVLFPFVLSLFLIVLTNLRKKLFGSDVLSKNLPEIFVKSWTMLTLRFFTFWHSDPTESKTASDLNEDLVFF